MHSSQQLIYEHMNAHRQLENPIGTTPYYTVNNHVYSMHIYAHMYVQVHIFRYRNRDFKSTSS